MKRRARRSRGRRKVVKFRRVSRRSKKVPRKRTGRRKVRRAGKRKSRGVSKMDQLLASATGPQYTVTGGGYGRRPSSSALQRSLVFSNMQKQIRRVQGVTPYDNQDMDNNTPGQYRGFLEFDWRGQNTTPVSTLMPMYIWELTSVNNLIRGAVVAGQPGFRMEITGTGANSSIVWNPVPGQNSGGGLQSPTTWNDVFTSGTGSTSGSDAYPGARDFLSWVKIKLLCYHANGHPQNWDVSIISLKDDWLAPDYPEVAVNGGVTQAAIVNGTDYYTEHSDFWQWMIRPYVSNPISCEATGTEYAKRVKFHKTIKWISQPITTLQKDGAPRHKQVNMFIRPNKVVRYDWQPTGGSNFGDPNGNAGEYAVNGGNLSCSPRPRERLYLMVRASMNYRIPPGTITGPELANVSSGIDYLIDTKHVTL